MKQLLFLCCVCFIFCTPLRTQEIEYGIKVGLNLADVYSNELIFNLNGTEETIDFKAKTVLRSQFGVWLNIPVSKQLSLQPELLYTQKAWLIDDDPNNPPTLYLDYLCLPILASYQFRNWRFDAGPELSLLLNDYYKEPNGSFTDENPFVEEYKLELGVNAGVRHVFNRWQLGLWYNIDLTPFVLFELRDANGDPSSETINLYNQGLQLSLGYRL
ncbi:MAG: porin family protein [Bacteroidota bacterium]